MFFKDSIFYEKSSFWFFMRVLRENFPLSRSKKKCDNNRKQEFVLLSLGINKSSEKVSEFSIFYCFFTVKNSCETLWQYFSEKFFVKAPRRFIGLWRKQKNLEFSRFPWRNFPPQQQTMARKKNLTKLSLNTILLKTSQK